MPSSVDLVPILDIETFWPHADKNIAKVIHRMDDDVSIQEVYEDLINRKRQLWLVFKKGEVVASVLTLIKEYRGKRVGVLTHAGGVGARDWFHIVNPIGAYFKAEGCEKFKIYGRRGWKKYLPDWRTDIYVYERSL